MIKYLGSKRSLLPIIQRVAQAVPDGRSAVDVFSGTARVGHALKSRGFQVFSNDHNAYGATLARCYVEADLDKVERATRLLLDEFGRLPGRPGYFTETFCEKSRFFQPKNGARVDAIREEIVRKGLDPVLESVVLVSLMEAADRVDSTCGVQMAYLKEWAPRAFNDLELRMPAVLPASPHGSCRAIQRDAADAIKELRGDVVYLDPPYNQHSYLGNYHVWESLILWDKPEVYGVACKRIDVRERKSAFNLRPRFKDAFAHVVRNAQCRVLVVSFNNEGYIARPEMEALLAERGPVFVIATDFKRYVGAQIGIYNPSGELVGEVSHLRNVEYLYIVDVARTGVNWDDLVRVLSTATDDVSTPALPVGSEERPRANRVPSEHATRVADVLVRLGHASSEDLQRATGLEASELRPILRGLISDGRVRTEGQRRGMTYRWQAPIEDVKPRTPHGAEATVVRRPAQPSLF